MNRIKYIGVRAKVVVHLLGWARPPEDDADGQARQKVEQDGQASGSKKAFRDKL